MKHLTFYLDFISPYAYLAFERLPQALQGLNVVVDYRPILFAGLLKHHGQLGPAEIAPKRDWTYRQVLWQAQHHGIPMALPAAHPFNPLSLLRLAMACALARGAATPNRYECERLFHHAWRGGLDAADPARLAALSTELLAGREPPAPEAVKQALQAGTDQALADGVFGVPSLVVDGRLFWGFDSLPMLREALEGHPWFEKNTWDAVRGLPVGTARKSA